MVGFYSAQLLDRKIDDILQPYTSTTEVKGQTVRQTEDGGGTHAVAVVRRALYASDVQLKWQKISVHKSTVYCQEN